MLLPLALALGLWLGLGLAAGAGQTGLHPEWPRRCGKTYMDGFPSFHPGGEVPEPAPLRPGVLALHMRLQTRYSVYLASETQAHFVVGADVSPWFGQRWPGLGSAPLEAPPVRFTIRLAANRRVVLAAGELAAGTTRLAAFNISRLAPRLEPYAVVLSAAAQPGAPNMTVPADVFYLPEKQHGSVARLDNLGGGIQFRAPAPGSRFEPFLPYGFFATCDEGCRLDGDSLEHDYRSLGFNSIVPLTTVDKSPKAFDSMEGLDVRFMYDLRHAYQNLSEVRRQVAAIKDHKALYAYWVADEPDRLQEPFEAVGEARAAIRAADPYHPVAVALSCQDYYYDRYSAGADMVLEDVYPVGVDTAFSSLWATPCNTTFGDCGCDNCRGGVREVARRLDNMARLERWLGRWPQTKAHVSQSFRGGGHWARAPRPDDAVAMVALALNHGAKLVGAWRWPTDDGLAHVHGRFATAVVQSPAGALIAGRRGRRLRIQGRPSVDVAYWASPTQLLVCVVNTRETPVGAALAIPVPPPALPAGARTAVLWGGGSWRVAGGELRLELDGIGAMSTHMVLLSAAQHGGHGGNATRS